jgi:HlyD family secretion protein
MKGQRLIKLCFVLILLGGASGGVLLLDGSEGPPEYRTAKVTRGDIAESTTVTGTLSAAKVVTVGTQVSGQVSKLNVKLNDEVKAGQLLAEIDPTLLVAQLKQDQTALETAKSNYEQAMRDLERTRALLAKDYVAKVDLEHAQQACLTAKNGYDGAKTVVERDQANLNYTKIASPIDGVVIDKQVDLGQTLAASLQAPTLFRIAGDFAQMKISLNLPEAYIRKVKEGMPVKFTVDAFPDREFAGTVGTVNLNPNTQNVAVVYSVDVSVDNPSRELLPGMTSYVILTFSKREKALRVPAGALRFVPEPEHISGLQRLFGKRSAPLVVPPTAKGGKTVYVLREGRLTPIPVKTGTTDDEYVEVSGEDIAEGDTVIVGVMAAKR